MSTVARLQTFGRRTLAPLSPGHRRWIRFLHSLPLDPDALARPLTNPTARDFIICGSPRTGTTLLAAALFQPPRIVTVMEPWDGIRLPPSDLFASLRQEMLDSGALRRGRLDVARLRANGEVAWCQEGAVPVDVEMSNDALLGVKWPGYWRYLSLLPQTRFLVCVRDPYETIASYKHAGGRVAQGLQYDTQFNRKLNAELLAMTRDPARRRVHLYDCVNRQILPFLDRPNVLVVRYERWFEDRAGLEADVTRFLGCETSPMPVTVRTPRSAPTLTDRDQDLIREFCETAEPLGYQSPTQSIGRRS